MIAVVLVAGVSRRLYPMTKNRPKCLLEIGNTTVFDSQMNALRTIGVNEVCLVLGYRREQIIEHAKSFHPDITFRHEINHHFFETNTAHSLRIAADQFLDRDMILLNGDVFFDPRILESVVRSPHQVAMAVEAKPCGEEEVKVIVDEENRIRRIGKVLPQDKCLGEYIGVAAFSAPTTIQICSALDRLIHMDTGQDAYYEDAIDALLSDHPFHAVDVTGFPCIEIDFPEDYKLARESVYPSLSQ